MSEHDPSLAPGEDPRASELLATGAARIERELADEPEVRADLLEAIARIETLVLMGGVVYFVSLLAAPGGVLAGRLPVRRHLES